MIEADFETRSDIDLKTHGAHVYFESPRARVVTVVTVVTV